jgi:hypothetical protein
VLQKGNVTRLDQAPESSFEPSVWIRTSAPATWNLSNAQLAQFVGIVTLNADQNFKLSLIKSILILILPMGLYLSAKEFTAQLGPKYSMADFTWLLQSTMLNPPSFMI